MADCLAATRLVFLRPDLLAADFRAPDFLAKIFFIYSADEDLLRDNSQLHYLGTVPKGLDFNNLVT